jgi:plasmid maintenance system antidote protein VapI
MIHPGEIFSNEFTGPLGSTAYRLAAGNLLWNAGAILAELAE